MISFIRKLLSFSRPYSQRLILGVLMGVLAGLMEPALMICVKFTVDIAFGTGTGSAVLAPENIKNYPDLIYRLKDHPDNVSKYVWSRLTPDVQQKISANTETNPVPKLVQQQLVEDLDRIILGPSIYDPQIFTNITFSKTTQKLLLEKSAGNNVPRLNRELLRDAYPGDFSGKLAFLDKSPWLQQHLGFLNHWLPEEDAASRSVNIKLVIISIPLVMFLRGLVSYLNVYFLQWVSIRAITDLRTKLFAHLLNMPLSFLNRVSTGEMLSRVTNDTQALLNTVSTTLVVLIKDPVTLLGLIALLLWQQPTLMLLSMIVFPICLVPIIIYTRKIRKSSSAIQTEYASLSRIMHESFTGNRIIKAYNLEDTVVGQFKHASARFVSQFMRAVRAGEMPGPLIEFFGALGVAFLFYYILLISHRQIDAGDFLLFVGSVFSMYRPIKSLTRLYAQLEQANAASERVFELLATSTSLPDPASPLVVKAAGAEIKFESIDFDYDTKPVLRDFNLTVKPGQMVALVGHTGSGKTTVTNLLLRFYDPQKGNVSIGGVDIRQILTKELRSQIAVVTQDTLLFDESIRRNIELGRPGATEEEIIAAAKHAHAHEFITEKPQGYDTLIGEKGVMLSGGQKQRLAIARAILKNAPILILDEATSSLDTQTERAVQEALEDLMHGRTTLCIAHRLSTIQKADVIVVLDKGRIAQIGRHDELVKEDGLYRRLYELSFQT